MAFLIGPMWPFLLLVAVFAAAAGWLWHLIRHEARVRELETERARLRTDLVSFVTNDGAAARAAEERAVELRKTREAVAEGAHRELQREFETVRAERDAQAQQLGELERALERAKARVLPAPAAVDDGRIAALEAEISRLTTQCEQLHEDARNRPDHTQTLRELSWRARYYQARTNYLENEGRAVRGVDMIAVRAVEAERDAARSDADALRSQLAAPPPPQAPDEALALKWRLRYLEARNRYLEGAGEDPEDKLRDASRMRYLEERLQHVQARDSAARAAAAAADTPAARTKWRMRYLASRVEHLEDELAERMKAPALAPVAAVAAEPSPPVVEEAQPEGLAAPRRGAPDDLTLIDGVGPKTETTLHALGIFHFDQIAAWSPANIAWVDRYLRFRGRIVREHWVEQARELARGAHAGRKLYFETEPA